MKREVRGVLFLAALSTGCATEQSKEESREPSHPPPAANSAPSLPVTLVPHGIVAGATNIDRAGLHKFSWASTNGPPSVWVNQVQAAAEYRCTSVGTVKALVAEIPLKGTGEPPLIEFRAQPELPADDWCWLVIQQSSGLRVGYGSGASGSWHAHFFTGSALRVVKLQVSSKNPDVVSIAFSEPFDAAQIVGKPIVKYLNGPATSCILMGAQCASTSAQFLTAAVDVRMTGSVGAGVATVTLAGSVLGSGRDVAAGAAATGDAMKLGNLELNVTQAGWSSCQDGAAMCWTDAKQLPAGP